MVRELNTKNYKTERKGFDILEEKLPNFYVPSLEEKKFILDLLGIDHRYSRTFDGILLKVDSVDKIKNFKDFTMIEVKTTKQVLDDFPSKFFFGMTLNEESFLKIFRNNYLLCLVGVTQREFQLLNFDELDELIHNNRTQFNINIK